MRLVLSILNMISLLSDHWIQNVSINAISCKYNISYISYIHILNECLVKLHLNNAIWATNKQSWHWGQLRLAICVWLSKLTSRNKAQVSTWLKNHWPLNGWIPNTRNVRKYYIRIYIYIFFDFPYIMYDQVLRDPHHSQVWMLPSCLQAALLRNTLRIKSIKFKKHCSISNPSSDMVLLHCESGNLNHLK